MTDWFRSWHGAPTDNKWLLIAKRAGVKPIHVSGTWWALMDHASQHSERGRVDDFDVETFALFSGMEEQHVSRIVTTLSEKGLIVNGRLANWNKRQPKREDETAAERKRRQRAKNGGKPPTNGPHGTRETPSEEARHAMSRNVPIEQNREDKSLSVEADASTGTVVPHPAADFCKAVFDSGVSLLARAGKTDAQARSIIGRWRKAVGDPELLTLLRHSEFDGHSDPVAWLTAAVETRNGKRTATDPLVAAYERACIDEAAESAGGGPEADIGTRLALPSAGTG